MKTTDYGISIAVFIILFSALVAEHIHNTQVIEEQQNTIFQLNSQIDDLKYQVGECRLLVANPPQECYR
jgi:hypothetical protein